MKIPIKIAAPLRRNFVDFVYIYIVFILFCVALRNFYEFPFKFLGLAL